MPDHEVIFSELSRELKAQVSPFVAVLHSKDCTGKKFVIKFVINSKNTIICKGTATVHSL